MADNCYIGIDTSNYTTSVALVQEDGTVLANLKSPLPVRAGECGLRQSDAVFAHVRNLPALMCALEEHLQGRTPLAVGVSGKPRDAKDSYMPCFLAGKAAAQALAAGLHVPLFPFSHQNGHLMAAVYGAGAQEALLGRAFGAFHVSGGTTELLSVKPKDLDFFVEKMGGTADLNAGQAVDRIGVMLGLDFPCGPALEHLAEQNAARVPRPRIAVSGVSCNLSGLENLARKLFEQSGDAPLVAAFTLDFIAETLAAMAENFRAEHGALPLLFAGGVMSNRRIANALRARFDSIYFAPPAYSADNAVGVALLCRARHRAKQ